MSEFKVTAFFFEDIENLNPELDLMGCDLTALDETMARTLWIDGEIMAAGGITLVWPGMGIVWAMVGDIPKRHLRKTVSLYRENMIKLMEANKIHRIQADVVKTFEKGLRFVRFFGFEHEGTMRAYGPGKEDYERFAFVRC